MTIASIAPQISAAGITAPTYSEILEFLEEKFRSIYGSDIYVAPDSQDGQWLAILAQAFHDQNDAVVAAYLAYSPTYAQGASLSSEVKINGIARKAPTYSVSTGNVVGTAGTTILNGVVSDINGTLWDLPPSVTIPGGGLISVDVVSQEPGSVVAAAGTINQIMTPTRGWQTFASTVDATVGQPVESDATLRGRQSNAAALPALSTNGGLLAALQDLGTVTRVSIYENDTDVVDAHGLVAHSIEAVIEGGVALDIATTIGQKKAPGSALNGTATQDYVDPKTGILYTIKYQVLVYTAVVVAITVKALSGWSSVVQAKIQAAVSAYIQGLAIGSKVMIYRVAAAAQLPGDPDALTFEVTVITLNGGGVDIVIAFDHAAKTLTTDVPITVT